MILAGRTAVVTGGGTGIGRAIALGLAQGGARVVLAGRTLATLQSVVDEIIAAGQEALAVRCDVTDADDVQALVTTATDRFSTLDVLINNAGITRDTLLMRMSDADWDAVLDTNLKGVYRCTKAVLRPMVRQRSGRIINVASIVGLMGNPGQANYAAAKAGIIGFTKSVAREVAPRGITVNAVAPGYIRTDMTDALTEQQQERLMTQIPMARMGTTQEVAHAVTFLASDYASYITGQTLVVDGGLVMQ